MLLHGRPTVKQHHHEIKENKKNEISTIDCQLKSAEIGERMCENYQQKIIGNMYQNTRNYMYVKELANT